MKKLSHGFTLDCFDCCKFNIYVDNDNIVKIEGDKNHPFTTGKFEIFFNDSLYKKHNNEEKFILLTNHTRDSLSSQHMMDKEGISIAYINKKMAKKLNVHNDEIVRLKNNNGEIAVKLNIDDIVADYVVLMYVGWWTKHGNPNYLTESGISDIGGQVTYNETKVEIIKK